MDLQKLLGQINGNIWIGKESLEINSDLSEVLQSPVDWIMNSPQIREIKDSGVLPAFNEGLDAIKPRDIQLLAASQLETCWGINKALNSQLHDGSQAGSGGSFLASSKVRKKDEEYYKIVSELWHEDLDREAVANFRPSMSFTLQEVAAHAVDLAMAKKQEWETQIKELSGGDNEKERWSLNGRLRRLKNALIRLKIIPDDRKDKSESLEDKRIILPKFAPIPIGQPFDSAQGPPLASPGAESVMSNIYGITDWAYKDIAKKFVIESVPSAAESSIIWATNSVVTKSLGSSMATAARYFSAGNLAAIAKTLPKTLTEAGTLTRAWTLLQTYALPIFIASLIVIVLIKSKQDEQLGELVYIWGIDGVPEEKNFKLKIIQRLIRIIARILDAGAAQAPDAPEPPDIMFAVIAPDPGKSLKDRDQVKKGKAAIKELALEMTQESGRKYQKLLAYNCGKKQEPRLIMDLTNPDKPEQVKFIKNPKDAEEVELMKLLQRMTINY